MTIRQSLSAAFIAVALFAGSAPAQAQQQPAPAPARVTLEDRIGTTITSGLHTADYAAAVRDGRTRALELALTFEGGLLLRREGNVIGAISASGARGSEDAQAVRAGVAAIGIGP